MTLTLKSSIKTLCTNNCILGRNEYGDITVENGTLVIPSSKRVIYMYNFAVQRWTKVVAKVITPSSAPVITTDNLVVYNKKFFDAVNISEDKIRIYYKELRERICFPIINRGKLWYDRLEPHQITELNDWYEHWLDITETCIVPEEPSWLNNKLKKLETEELL